MVEVLGPPDQLAGRQGDADRAAEGGAGVAVGAARWRRAPATTSRVPRGWPPTARRRSTARPAASSAEIPPGGAAATLRPTPTTTASRSASARIPASLRSPTIRSFGHLISGLNPATRSQAPAAARPTAAASRWRRSGARPAGPEQHRDQQRGARRRRPGPAQAAPAGRLVVGQGDGALAAPCPGLAEQPGVGRPDAVELADRHRTRVDAASRWRVRSSRIDPDQTALVLRAHQGADRQPGRDRRPGHPHVPGDGDRHRGRLLRPRPRRPPRPPGRRGVRPRRPDARPRAISTPARSSTPSGRSGADAVHPGLRLLHREHRLRPGDHRRGVACIGPPPEAIEVMGDKISSRIAAERAGVRACRAPPSSSPRPTRSWPSARSSAGRWPSRPPTAAAVGACRWCSRPEGGRPPSSRPQREAAVGLRAVARATSSGT